MESGKSSKLTTLFIGCDVLHDINLSIIFTTRGIMNMRTKVILQQYQY